MPRLSGEAIHIAIRLFAARYALRRKVVGESRSKSALILLQQEGSRELGWTAHKFWRPLFAAPTDAEPCIFATKVAN